MDETPTVADVQTMFDRSPFMTFAGMKVVGLDAEEETITVHMSMRPEFERRPGTGQWHGGPIAALIDVAGDYALIFHVGAGVPTINFRTDYLRPAMNTSLTAVAKVRRAGRSVGVVDIEVTNDEGKLVALGRGCYGTTAG